MTLAIKKTLLLTTALLAASFAYSAKLAIVIDDLGYHAKEDEQILAIFSFICPWKRCLK